MKLARLSALTAAMVLASAAQANDILSNGSLDIHLRNFYLDAKTDSDSDVQWSQAISADFVSGFYGNIIGFDLGAHYALKLRGDNEAGDSGPGLLPVNPDGKSGSYGKTSYAIKVNLADMGVAKYGRMFLDTPLLNNNYSRSLPGLTEAFYVEGNLEGANLYGVWATKTNMRTESGFMDLMIGDKKEAVKVLGGGYDFGNGMAANLAVGQQSDYYRKYYFDLGYAMDMQDLFIDSRFQYGRNSALGAQKDNLGSADDSQNVWGLNLTAEMQQATLGISYQRVSQSGNSFENTWSGQDSSQVDSGNFFGPNALMISDFNGDGQKSWALNAGYDFAGMVDGFSVDVAFAKGGVDSRANTGDTNEKEYNLTAAYALPQVENLSIAARYAKNTSKVKSTGETTTKKQIRLVVKYDMSVF